LIVTDDEKLSADQESINEIVGFITEHPDGILACAPDVIENLNQAAERKSNHRPYPNEKVRQVDGYEPGEMRGYANLEDFEADGV
jgi:hypothetical protein